MKLLNEQNFHFWRPSRKGGLQRDIERVLILFGKSYYYRHIESNKDMKRIDHFKMAIITTLIFSVSSAGFSQDGPSEDSPLQAAPAVNLSDAGLPQKEAIFIEENGLKFRISDMEDIAFGYVHTAKFSPDSDVLIVTEETGVGAYRLATPYLNSHSIENISGSPQDFTWSSSGQYVVFHNVDVYAGAGSTGLMLLNVQSGKYIEISKDQFINGKDLGQREKLNIYSIVWLDSNSFSLIASAGYLGESGHPGINYNRMNELGDNLGNRDDNILVANWKVEIINDDSIIPDEISENDSF